MPLEKPGPGDDQLFDAGPYQGVVEPLLEHFDFGGLADVESVGLDPLTVPFFAVEWGVQDIAVRVNGDEIRLAQFRPVRFKAGLDPFAGAVTIQGAKQFVLEGEGEPGRASAVGQVNVAADFPGAVEMVDDLQESESGQVGLMPHRPGAIDDQGDPGMPSGIAFFTR